MSNVHPFRRPERVVYDAEPVNEPKMEPKKTSGISPTMLIVLAGGLFLLAWQRRRNEEEALESRIAEMEESAARNQAFTPSPFYADPFSTPAWARRF